MNSVETMANNEKNSSSSIRITKEKIRSSNPNDNKKDEIQDFIKFNVKLLNLTIKRINKKENARR